MVIYKELDYHLKEFPSLMKLAIFLERKLGTAKPAEAREAKDILDELSKLAQRAL